MTTRSFFRDGLSVYLTKLWVLGLSVFSVVIQAKALGPDGRGSLAMLLIYPQLFSAIAEGGMRQATVYYVGRQLISDGRVVGASILYTLVSALTFSTLIFFLVAHNQHHRFSAIVILAAASLLPFNLTLNAIRGIFLGKQHITQFNTTQWLQKLVQVGVLATLFGLGYLTVETAVLTLVLATLTSTVPAIYFFCRHLHTRIELHLPTLWLMVRKGCVYAAALALVEANYRLDILLLGWLSNQAEVGRYAVAVQVGELLWQLPAAIGIVVFSRSANEQNSVHWHRDLARSIRLSLWLTLGGALGLMLVAPLLFQLLFGPGFAGSATMTLWLLPGLILMVAFKLLNMDLAGKGKPYVSLCIMLPALLLNVALNYLLIPSLGGNGAAIASTISYSAAAIAMLATCSRMHGLRWRDLVLIQSADIRMLGNKFGAWTPLRKEA